jgi:cobalt-zinc-cadmium efflux system protein
MVDDPTSQPGPHGHDPSRARRALTWTLALNAAFLVLEAGVGLATGSLALLSDAAHMVSDVAALAVALGASWLAGHHATRERTFGWQRAEVLGAFLNSLGLLLVVGFIVREAVIRLLDGSPAVPPGPVLVVGLAGLVVNLASAWHLWRSDRDNLNVRAALLHMLGDALGSLAAVVAALLLEAGVSSADAVAGLVVAALVLWGAFRLLAASGRILLQFAPEGFDAGAVRDAILSVDGVLDVHDVHVWSLDGRISVFTAHVVAASGRADVEVRRAVETLLCHRFGIEHTTLQVEAPGACLANGCVLEATPR